MSLLHYVKVGEHQIWSTLHFYHLYGDTCPYAPLDVRYNLGPYCAVIFVPEGLPGHATRKENANHVLDVMSGKIKKLWPINLIICFICDPHGLSFQVKT